MRELRGLLDLAERGVGALRKSSKKGRDAGAGSAGEDEDLNGTRH